jgi:hypothetical protein
MWRHSTGTAIFAIVVSVASVSSIGACSSDPPDAPSAVGLPSRSRRDSGSEDAKSNVLEPVDAAAIDSGPPPDPFCAEPGLVLCFTFDNAVENQVAATPKLVPAQVIGFSLVDGKKNKAARLDTGSAVTFDYSPLLEMQTASVEAWVNRDLATFADDTVFDDDERFAMSIEADGTLRCNTSTAAARGGKVGIEQWSHVACVFDGATIKAYVDGAEVASAPGTIGISKTAGAAIGDNSPNGGEGFAGEIDSFRVWNTARSATQISAAAQN